MRSCAAGTSSPAPRSARSLSEPLTLLISAVLAVGAVPRAPAADRRLEVEERLRRCGGRCPRAADHHRVAVARAGRLLRQHRRRAPCTTRSISRPSGVKYHWHGDGSSAASIEPGRTRTEQRAERAAVRRVVGVDQELVGDAAGGDRLRLAAVDRPPAAASSVPERSIVIASPRDLDAHAHPARLAEETPSSSRQPSAA